MIIVERPIGVLRERLAKNVQQGAVTLAGVIGVALMATACTGGSGPGRPGSTSSSRPPRGPAVLNAAPSLRPLALSAKPLWSERTKSVSAAALHGDSAVIVTNDAKDRERLTVLDVATGKPRWSVEAYGAPVPDSGGLILRRPAGPGDGTVHIAGQGGDWGILVDYLLTTCRNPTGFCPVGSGTSDETGLALLSGKDGHVRWKLPLVPARTGKAAKAGDRRLSSALVDASDKVALGVVKPEVYGRRADVRLVAVDVATGRRMWTRNGVQTILIAGETVFGRAQANPDRPSEEFLGGGPVIALDAATGRTRWDLSAQLPSSTPELAAGDIALVRAFSRDNRIGPPVLIDAATGRRLAGLPDGTTKCASDDLHLIACTVEEPADNQEPTANPLRTRLLTIDSADRTVKMAAKDLPDSALTAVWQDRVFLDDKHGGAVDVDRAANRLNGDLPGSPIALADRYAIFASSNSTGTRYAAYRVG